MTRRPNPESAAAMLTGDKDRLRVLAYNYIQSRGKQGTTADECCAALGMVHNSIAPRLTELKAAGTIVELYDAKGNRVRRKTRMGCDAGVMVASEFAPRNHWEPVPKPASSDGLFSAAELARCIPRWFDPEEKGGR